MTDHEVLLSPDPPAVLGGLGASVKWKRPSFSGLELRKQLRTAERVLRVSHPGSSSRADAVNIINDWRISHQFPLHIFQQTLRVRTRSVEQDALVVQRIKKMDTIESKIGRVDKLELWDMQDVGGCRAIVSDIAAVRKLADSYHDNPLRHRLKRTKDYITTPKPDGYRGIHLVHVYQHENELHAPWTGYQIEIQLRTRLQHAWAAAIETVDLFDEQDLKFGGGKPDWRRFFLLMSAYISKREQSPSVIGVPSNHEDLCVEIGAIEKRLDIRQKLGLWRAVAERTMETVKQKDSQYFVLDLNLDKGSIAYTAFGNKKDNEESQARAAANAAKKLLQIEAVHTGRRSVVLVGARSLRGVKAAFPAYFADTERFVLELGRALSAKDKRNEQKG